MTTDFANEENAFLHMKRETAPAVKEEFEEALRVLVGQYNTFINENRFVVGGVVEILILGLLRSVDVKCDACGATEQHGDIRLNESDSLLSVKSSLVGVAPIRLINKQGEGVREWKTATLFVVAGIGVVFGAPDMVSEYVVGDGKDAMELKQAGLRKLVDNPRYVMSVEVPRTPGKELADTSLMASPAVADRVLADAGSKILHESVKDVLRKGTLQK